MKLYYSPYFDGSCWYNLSAPVRMNEKTVGTSMLLEELELLSGRSHSSKDINAERVKAYHDLLSKEINWGNLLWNSYNNDNENNGYPATTELLKWRDSMIMCGWSGEDLPGKLAVLSNAEKNIPADSVIRAGEADRWKELKDNVKDNLKEIEIEVRCPKILIPKVIVEVLVFLNANFTCESLNVTSDIQATIYTCNDITEVYEWLAMRVVDNEEMVVCSDSRGLDSVMKSFHKPKVGDAEIGCHRVASDVRNQLDAPKSIVWIDCYGDYGLDYPYSFMSNQEYHDLKKTYDIPTKEEMLASVQKHVNSLLSKTKKRIFIHSKYDCGNILGEHPIITQLVHQGINESGLPKPSIARTNPKDETRFEELKSLEISGCNLFRDTINSYSSVDKMINHHFDYVLEYMAGLWSPDNEEDLRTEMGTVAHRAVELMANANLVSVNNIAGYVDKAIDEKGDILKRAENQFALEEFKALTIDSIKTLLMIIKNNNLEIVASEMNIPEKKGNNWDGVPIDGLDKCHGSLDLVLKRGDDYFIFDSKYSSSDRYRKKLMNNDSLQLELYRRLFDNHSGLGKVKVKAMGYYLFPLKTLFMTESDFNESEFLNTEHIEVVKPDVGGTDYISDCWNDIKAKYRDRKTSMEKGEIIEEVEPPYKEQHMVLKNKIR